MNHLRYNRVATKAIYMKYSFKKNPDFSLTNTVPDPYIKSSECTDTPLSISYFDWKPIIDDYINCIGEVLISGNNFKIPLFMGEIQLRKIKMKTVIDRIASKKEGRSVERKGTDCDNYVLRIKWSRGNKEAKLSYKYHWTAYANTSLLKKAYARCENDYTYINNFRDI